MSAKKKATPSEAAQRLVKKRGKAYMREIAGRGGDATRAKYGPDFMRDISKKGVDARKRIWEAGKAALDGEKK
jgi:3-methyladenine DNA glycosylase AlkD